jgi:hypothetical protein
MQPSIKIVAPTLVFTYSPDAWELLGKITDKNRIQVAR